MANLTLTKTGLQAGIWQGLLTGATETPTLEVTHEDRVVPELVIASTRDESTWLVQFPIPAEAIADGVHTLLVNDTSTGTTLDRVTLIAGEALGEDLRAEVNLLRAELDMLKRAFRRHCRETG